MDLQRVKHRGTLQAKYCKILLALRRGSSTPREVPNIWRLSAKHTQGSLQRSWVLLGFASYFVSSTTFRYPYTSLCYHAAEWNKPAEFLTRNTERSKVRGIIYSSDIKKPRVSLFFLAKSSALPSPAVIRLMQQDAFCVAWPWDRHQSIHTCTQWEPHISH